MYKRGRAGVMKVKNKTIIGLKCCNFSSEIPVYQVKNKTIIGLKLFQLLSCIFLLG